MVRTGLTGMFMQEYAINETITAECPFFYSLGIF